jgi:hypothetical protein
VASHRGTLEELTHAGIDTSTRSQAMSTFHVPSTYIWITSLILVGLGILGGVTHTRSKDMPK